MEYEKAREYILGRLQQELSEKLTYHCFEHTVDVYEAAIFLAGQMKLDQESLILLKTAALYHDCGFLISFKDHETLGCELVREQLPGFGFTENQVERVCRMIMATKIPQSPHDLASEILCDADLDYLGRNDFGKIGATLFAEFLDQGIVQGEESWNRLQQGFLGGHRYFTRYSREHREPVKQAHLREIKHLVASYS